MTLPVLHDMALDTLWHASLLCEVCQAQPWTQHAQRHTALICADCAAGEPETDGD